MAAAQVSEGGGSFIMKQEMVHKVLREILENKPGRVSFDHPVDRKMQHDIVMWQYY